MRVHRSGCWGGSTMSEGSSERPGDGRPIGRRLSRRELLRGAAWLGALTPAVLLLQACGQAAPPAPTAAPAAPAKPAEAAKPAAPAAPAAPGAPAAAPAAPAQQAA